MTSKPWTHFDKRHSSTKRRDFGAHRRDNLDFQPWEGFPVGVVISGGQEGDTGESNKIGEVNRLDPTGIGPQAEKLGLCLEGKEK